MDKPLKSAAKPKAKPGDLLAQVAKSKAVSNKAPAKTSSSEAEYTASDIEVLEGLEPVRRRPGMYIGGTDEKALHHLFAEVIDNSMDEALAGHATFIEVELGADGFLTVTDNGLGIPVDPRAYPVWANAINLPAATAVQYKYYRRNADGSVTWENIPGGGKRSVVTAGAGGTTTVNDTVSW